MHNGPITSFKINWEGDDYMIRRHRWGGLIAFGPRGGYRVSESGNTCSCPGCVYGATRGELSQCRHMKMVALVLAWLKQHRTGCSNCGSPLTRPGRGRCFGEHPDHRYCSGCSMPARWFRAA